MRSVEPPENQKRQMPNAWRTFRLARPPEASAGCRIIRPQLLNLETIRPAIIKDPC